VAAGPLIDVIIPPDRYDRTPPEKLIEAAALGLIGIDHRLLHSVLDDRERAIAGILAYWEGDREEDRVSLSEDLIRIARYLNSERLIPVLVDLVAEYAGDVPDELVETVCGFRGAALEPLLVLYRELGPETVSEVPFLLASLGVKDERIEDVIRDLGALDPADASFCLEIYREVSRGTAEIEPYDIWAEYPEEAPPVFEALTPEERLDFLNSESPELRSLAVASFYNEPEIPREVLNRLREMARADAEPEVRAAAWRSLALEVEDEELIAEMEELLLKPETPLAERAGLVVALAPGATRKEIRDRVLEVFGSPQTRASAVEAMWRSADRTYTTYIRKALDDADDEVREQALLGVGYLGLAGELGRVKNFFPEANLRPAALMSYSLAVPAKETPAHMRSLFKKIEDLAGGLEPQEADIVRLALDQRLAAAGQEPVFGIEG
jgi:hypothetical protein